MPLIETKGAASAQGFGLTLGGAQPVYIEDVFSTWLYTGNGSTQTITNGIDLSTKGGLVWVKTRTSATNHVLVDSARSLSSYLASNLTNGSISPGWPAFVFNANGFSIPFTGYTEANATGQNYVSWTFRKQPKFFDVVTYTGNGASNNTISHSLGSIPGCVIVKKTSGAAAWPVWHRTFTTDQFMLLNATNAVDIGTGVWGTSGFTSTSFSVGTSNSEWNQSGQTYVAYLFAHNAGGFGLSGTDNVISCGSFTTSNGVSGLVNIGYEPQWVLIKRTDSSVLGNWQIYDTMRGAVATNNAGTYDQPAQLLVPNTSAAEANTTGIGVYQQGFNFNNGSGTSTYIYIAIRRGPMKVPTSGTSVFSPNATSATTNTKITTGFPLDLNIVRNRTASSGFQSGFAWSDRLRGLSSTANATTTGLQSTNSNAETTGVWGLNNSVDNTGFGIAADYSGLSQIYYNFRRAPGFFDVVCYTGTGATRTVNHNLGVAPQLIIIKARDATWPWPCYVASLGNTKMVYLNTTASAYTVNATYWNLTNPTASVFSLGTDTELNAAAGTKYVAYLFATCAGVSKVGSYTGTGANQTIDCGFTGGARFVLIRRTDSTGDWYVYDSARGISSGNDPYLLLNSTAAEVTGTNYVDTTSVGFQVTAAAPAGLNANGGTYIFLAIA